MSSECTNIFVVVPQYPDTPGIFASIRVYCNTIDTWAEKNCVCLERIRTFYCYQRNSPIVEYKINDSTSRLALLLSFDTIDNCKSP